MISIKHHINAQLDFTERQKLMFLLTFKAGLNVSLDKDMILVINVSEKMPPSSIFAIGALVGALSMDISIKKQKGEVWGDKVDELVADITQKH
jgi:hypothetical protein